MPHSNQQIAPALTPESTVPRSQARRRTAPRECTAQIAIRFAVLPPPT